MTDATDALRALLDGYLSSSMLFAAARLGVADGLSGGPRTAEHLAAELCCQPVALRRFLRGLVSIGVCTEEEDGSFTLTPLGRPLCRDTAGSLSGYAILMGEEYMPAWAALTHSVRTGGPAFHHVFGLSPWQHRKIHPELSVAFLARLRESAAAVARSLARAYDFAPLGAIVDVGGGDGSLLAGLLDAVPGLSGEVFEQPHVAAAARARLEEAGLGSRSRAVAGDFFAEIPRTASALLMKSILHDWDDVEAGRVLASCRRALEPGGTLLVVERLLPDRATAGSVPALVDLEMLVVTGGQERTAEGYRALLAAGGFAVRRIIPTDSGFAILECVPS